MEKETAKSNLFAVVLVTAEKDLVIKVGNEKHIAAIIGEPMTLEVKGVEVDFFKNPQAVRVFDLETFSRAMGLIEAVECMQELAKSDLNDFAILGIDWQALPR